MHRKTKYFLTFLILFLACHLSLSAKSFEVRAVYLDFRTQVMTMPAMKEFVADAASKGMNAVVVEWEATFPFKDNLVLRNRFAFSEAEVKDFIAYCSGLGVDVIPLQNCFGHSEYILRHERYAVLKEDRKDCSQVCPMMEDEAEGIFRSIFSEIAQMHTSGYFHIGCDETRLLGHCRRCQEKVRSEGISRLYVDYVARMCRIVSSLGKRPMIWADIILKHPEALQSLPEDVIIVDWNYGWDQDHFGKMDNLRNSGREVWGACSLRSHPDNLYLVQWRKHLENIFSYTSYASDCGFKGIINTSWSTSGTYGYIYDDKNEVIAIQPVREVYPQNGFDMLMTAYSNALSDNPLTPDKFLESYCHTRLGLGPQEETEVVKDYFNMTQSPVYSFQGDIARIDEELRKCTALRERLDMVRFSKDAADVARHLRLMLDIRINYLEFKRVDLQIESNGFSVEDSRAALAQLKSIDKECGGLRKEFIRLNGHYLKDAGESFNEWTYRGKIKERIKVLENIR